MSFFPFTKQFRHRDRVFLKSRCLFSPSQGNLDIGIAFFQDPDVFFLPRKAIRASEIEVFPFSMSNMAAFPHFRHRKSRFSRFPMSNDKLSRNAGASIWFLRLDVSRRISCFRALPTRVKIARMRFLAVLSHGWRITAALSLAGSCLRKLGNS